MQNQVDKNQSTLDKYMVFALNVNYVNAPAAPVPPLVLSNNNLVQGKLHWFWLTAREQEALDWDIYNNRRVRRRYR